MEWSTLSIISASIVQKEVDTAITLLKKYSEDNSPKLSGLVDSVKKRIDELEVFYGSNDDDDRAVLFEKERMKLRKALQNIVGITTPQASSSSSTLATTTTAAVTTKPFFVPNQTYSSSSSISPPKSQIIMSSSSRAAAAALASSSPNKLDVQDLNDTKRPLGRSTSMSPTKSIGVESFSVSARAIGQSRAKQVEPHPMTKKLSTQIYAWEGGRELRGKIQVDDNSYIPTSVAGVYVREDGVEQVPSTDKWIDVKVVLTQEELTTLASRKKAMKRAKNLGLSASNHVSIQSSTPYIDPRRIVKETYRPDKPEKWILPVYHNK